MIRIKRGKSLYEIFEHSDHTEINIYEIRNFHGHPPVFQRTVIISRNEHRSSTGD